GVPCSVARLKVQLTAVGVRGRVQQGSVSERGQDMATVVAVFGKQTARTELNASKLNGIGFEKCALAGAAVIIFAEASVTTSASSTATYGTLRASFAPHLP